MSQVKTKLETEVAIIKTNQKNMEKTIEEIKEVQKEQTDDIKAILERLDNLSGGKTALMWITGIFLSLSGLIIAYINSIRHP